MAQGLKGSRSGFLTLWKRLIPFLYLHSRGKDFNSVFARHSDDNCSARVPGRATEATTAAELASTVTSSTGVSRLCHLTPLVAKKQQGHPFSLPLPVVTDEEVWGQNRGVARMSRRAHRGTILQFRFASQPLPIQLPWGCAIRGTCQAKD